MSRSDRYAARKTAWDDTGMSKTATDDVVVLSAGRRRGRLLLVLFVLLLLGGAGAAVYFLFLAADDAAEPPAAPSAPPPTPLASVGPLGAGRWALPPSASGGLLRLTRSADGVLVARSYDGLTWEAVTEEGGALLECSADVCEPSVPFSDELTWAFKFERRVVATMLLGE